MRNETPEVIGWQPDPGRFAGGGSSPVAYHGVRRPNRQRRLRGLRLQSGTFVQLEMGRGLFSRDMVCAEMAPPCGKKIFVRKPIINKLLCRHRTTGLGALPSALRRCLGLPCARSPRRRPRSRDGGRRSRRQRGLGDRQELLSRTPYARDLSWRGLLGLPACRRTIPPSWPHICVGSIGVC